MFIINVQSFPSPSGPWPMNDVGCVNMYVLGLVPAQTRLLEKTTRPTSQWETRVCLSALLCDDYQCKAETHVGLVLRVEILPGAEHHDITILLTGEGMYAKLQTKPDFH